MTASDHRECSVCGDPDETICDRCSRVLCYKCAFAVEGLTIEDPEMVVEAEDYAMVCLECSSILEN